MHDESSWGKASMNPVSPLETLKAGLHWPQDENVIEEFSVRINKELQKWQVVSNLHAPRCLALRRLAELPMVSANRAVQARDADGGDFVHD